MDQVSTIDDLFNWAELLAPRWNVEWDCRLYPYGQPVSKPDTIKTPPPDYDEYRPGYQRFEKDGRIWYSLKKPDDA